MAKGSLSPHFTALLRRHPDFPGVIRVIRKLQRAGHPTFLIGGCMRDAFLGRLPRDFDITTSASPEEVMRIFPSTIPLWHPFHWMAVILHHSTTYDIKTYRFSRPGPHPRDAAQWVDFTINNLLWDPIADRLYDFTGARRDLQDGIVRTSGDPEDCFRLDWVRMIRAVRFAAAFDFMISPETVRSIRRHAGRIRQVHPDRLRVELMKVLSPPLHASALPWLKRTGLWKVLKDLEENPSEIVHAPSKGKWIRTGFAIRSPANGRLLGLVNLSDLKLFLPDARIRRWWPRLTRLKPQEESRASACLEVLRQAGLVMRTIPRRVGSPRVSVVVEVRRAGPRLSETLDSLLAQRYPFFEIWMIAKQTDPRIESLRAQFRWCHALHWVSPQAFRLSALAEYVLVWPESDLLRLSTLERLVADIDRHPAADWTAPGELLVDAFGRAVWNDLTKQSPAFRPGVLVRRKALCLLTVIRSGTRGRLCPGGPLVLRRRPRDNPSERIA